MKLIFSRKGFDSSAGGVPSPIVDGNPISLPIPTRMPSPIRYRDLSHGIVDLVVDLTNGRINANRPCHVDPDLDASSLPRAPGWRGSLGQVGAAQGHLSRQKVESGDLFLFWGLFRAIEKSGGHWRFAGAAEHRLFGWLQIAEVITLGCDGSHVLQRYPWLIDHPHVRSGWPANNTIYIARDQLALGSRTVRTRGFGQFQQGRRLTVEESPLKSVWAVPDWLNPKRDGVGMTYHPLERWTIQGTVRTAARGQEFVADLGDRGDALDWLAGLFANEF
jgi:hypothetical protein